MSFVNPCYRCDLCGIIKEEAEIVGILPIEDLFDRLKNFPVTYKPIKATVHYCLLCYRLNVLDVAQRIVNRRKSEEAYKLKVKELSYDLRKTCVQNFRMKKTWA